MDMEPTTLQKLLETGLSTKNETGLEVKIPSSWIVRGEDRLSYTTMVRLMECCRELHWERDVIPYSNGKIDSICKSIRCEFSKPVFSGTMIRIEYRITEVRKKSYSIYIKMIDGKGDICSEAWLVSVFYDPIGNCPCVPSTNLVDYLQKLVEVA